MLLPRTAIAYPFYIIASFLILKKEKQVILRLLMFLALITVFFIINLLFFNISITSFILSVFLQLPFILFICGAKIKTGLSTTSLIRDINLGILILSIINLVLQGFPLKLPYIDFSPDYYSAFFGFGGAKIVTVIGFFGFAHEISNHKENRSKIFLIIGLINFIFPSYLIGIISGCIAFWLHFLKKIKLKKVLLSIIILGCLFPFINSRVSGLNNEFENQVGYIPKVYSYISIVELYSNYPSTILIGTGIGQFTSTSALWASEYLSQLSTHSIPDSIGLSMSEFHDKILGKVLNLFISSDEYSWELSSSVNKPYSSLTTLLSEYGLVLTIILVYIIIKRLNFTTQHSDFYKLIMFFCLIIFLVDNWHDNPWFGYMLLTLNSFNRE